VPAVEQEKEREHMNRGRSWIWPLGFTVLVTALAAGCGQGAGHPGSAAVPASRSGTYLSASAAGLGSALVGSAPVGNGPSELALDAATHTIYVANGYNDNGPNAGGNTVSVIDARHCQAMDVSRCKGPWPTITVGNLPSTIAIDSATDTVYVTDTGANTVSVFNGATCNALVTSGCGQKPATVPVGLGPLGIFADPANHTVYIPNFGNGQGASRTVSMLNSATCNAAHLAACPAQPPPTVNVGAAPDDVDVNRATHTVYVTTTGAHNGWSVLNADTCNATVHTGCGATGRLPGDPAGPNAGQVDPANDTLYTANYDNTISAFDLRHCDASDLAGCATVTPGTVKPFPPSNVEHALWLAVDVPLHSVYVAFPARRRADRGRHGCVQRNRPGGVRQSAPARGAHGRAARIGRARRTDADPVHRQSD
jgi:DNA-binding beta-propeller fold protein YncE